MTISNSFLAQSLCISNLPCQGHMLVFALFKALLALGLMRFLGRGLSASPSRKKQKHEAETWSLESTGRRCNSFWAVATYHSLHCLGTGRWQTYRHSEKHWLEGSLRGGPLVQLIGRMTEAKNCLTKPHRKKWVLPFPHLAQVTSQVHHSCMNACASTKQVTAWEWAEMQDHLFQRRWNYSLGVSLNDNLSQSLPKVVVTLFSCSWLDVSHGFLAQVLVPMWLYCKSDQVPYLQLQKT